MGRLSPLPSSKCVKRSSSLLALPEVIISFMAATGAACIDWTALSTKTMASVTICLRDAMSKQRTEGSKPGRALLLQRSGVTQISLESALAFWL